MATRLLYSNDRGALEQEGWWGTVLNAASKRPWVTLPRAFVFGPGSNLYFVSQNPGRTVLIMAICSVVLYGPPVKVKYLNRVRTGCLRFP